MNRSSIIPLCLAIVWMYSGPTAAAQAPCAYPLSITVPKGLPAPVYDRLEIVARDGVRLVVHRWTPPNIAADKPVVLFVHGLGSHGEPFASIAAGFTSRQMTLLVPDLRGHGRSEGKRGKLADWSILRADLGEVIGLVNRRHPEARVFLAGESMGGLIAADYAVHGERRLAGLMLLAPAFKVHEAQIKLSGVEEFIKGHVILNTDKKIKPSTREPGFIEARMKDPFVLTEIDSSYLVSIRLRQRDWPSSALLLKLPLFIGVAGHDEIVSPKAAKAVFDLAATPKEAKTWRHWDDARHTVCWDPLTPLIVEDMTAWMRETLK